MQLLCLGFSNDRIAVLSSAYQFAAPISPKNTQLVYDTVTTQPRQTTQISPNIAFCVQSNTIVWSVFVCVWSVFVCLLSPEAGSLRSLEALGTCRFLPSFLAKRYWNDAAVLDKRVILCLTIPLSDELPGSLVVVHYCGSLRSILTEVTRPTRQQNSSTAPLPGLCNIHERPTNHRGVYITSKQSYYDYYYCRSSPMSEF